MHIVVYRIAFLLQFAILEIRNGFLANFEFFILNLEYLCIHEFLE